MTCCRTPAEIAAAIARRSGEPCQPARIRRLFDGDDRYHVEPFAGGTIERCPCPRGFLGMEGEPPASPSILYLSNANGSG
jgi:hypothetical protein